MSTVIYVALVSGGQADGYKAHFHDLPDCAVSGGGLAELLINARQALIERLEAFETDGDAWPSATPIEQITPQVGAMPIPVDVTVDDPPIRVNISLGERLVQRLDAAASAGGMTRSGYIAKAVRVSLGEGSQAQGDFDAVSRRLQDELSVLGRRINDSIGPDSAFTRRMNELDERLYEGVRKAADNVSAAMARKLDDAKAAGGGETPAPAAS
ncbi:type II toxin-antitoxin system HicB family antitoxin [Caulobacter sp. DWR2-3-1b2]|uniref:type II toxin-antitoxin system HicB family antitoxin n=1 Tax=unclassified Caulobacter TaxID=2648921 RepID=UPI0019AF2137|nr:type II toxin-antitoxin system HicB family antitoxin [Caulobacter sp.]